MKQTRHTLRHHAKRAAAHAMIALHPTARYDKMFLVLSHMRSATTAMSNVLCSHQTISGYGETHVSHDNEAAPGQVAVNLFLRRALPRGSAHLFDKILHNHLDSQAVPEFFNAKALFLLRQPWPSVASIQKLAVQTGMEELTTAQGAATYYAARLDGLARLWDLFPRDNRVGLTAERLLADPDRRVPEIGEWLGLEAPLVNAYTSHNATQRGGGGDPTQSAKHTKIEARAVSGEAMLPSGVSAALAQRCVQAHQDLVHRFSES